MKEPECLIFDFGNVVAFFNHRKACSQLAKMSSTRWNEDDIYEEIFRSGGLEEQYDRGAISTKEFLTEITQRFQISSDDKEVKVAWSDIFWPNKTVIDLIQRLRAMSYRLILASNTNDLHYKWFREKFSDVLERFHHLVLSHEIRCRKPDKEFYEKCIEKAGCEASQCVYIDDRSDFVKAARTYGLKGIMYISTDTLLQELEKLGIPIIQRKSKLLNSTEEITHIVD